MRRTIPINEQAFIKIKEFRDYLLIEKKMRFKNYSEFLEWLIEQAKEKISLGDKNERNDSHQDS